MFIKIALRNYIKRIKSIMVNYLYPEVYYHLSVIISCLVFFTSFDLDVAVNVIILGTPGILFLISSTIYTIAQKVVRQNKFNFIHPNLLFRLSEAEQVKLYCL